MAQNSTKHRKTGEVLASLDEYRPNYHRQLTPPTF